MISRLPGDNPLASSGTPVIYNLTLTSANTEYPQTMPIDVRKFAVRPRTSSHVLKMSYTEGESGTNYITVDSSGFAWNDHIAVSGLVLYFQSATAGAIVEIEAWA